MNKWVMILNERASKCITGLIVMVVLSGCASVGGAPAFMLPTGSKVQVNQDLSAVSGARVTIQYGRVIPRSEVSVIDPHCQFYLHRSREEMNDPVVVRPGTFTVKRVYQRQAYDGLQLAATQFVGDPTRYPTTVMELSSAQQPEVRDLRCAIWGTPYVEGFLTIDQMRAALGDSIELIIVNK